MYIAQVRNPFDRFESMWKHLVRAGFVHSSFNDGDLNAISSLQGEIGRLVLKINHL